MNPKGRRSVAVGAVLLVALTAGFGAWAYFKVDQRTPLRDVAVTASAVAAPSAGLDDDIVRFAAHAPQLAMIQTQVLRSSPVPLTESLSARVAYDEDVTARIGVSITGRIVALRASVGDVVKAGQVLAEIDSPDYGSADADLRKAAADELRKRLVVERARVLAPGEAMAAKDVDLAEADYVQARAETARAEQRIRNLNPSHLPVHGQRIGLASPFDGVVTERTASPALEVGPTLTAPLFVVTDPRRLSLLIDLPERLLSRVQMGSRVAVTTDAYPKTRFEARIVQLGQVVDPNSRRVVVRARVFNPERQLLPEMFVRAALLKEVGTGVQVPNGALVNRGVHDFVFVEVSEGQFRREQVELTTRGSDFSFVGAGLQDGDRVVTAGALLLDSEVATRVGGNGK